MSGTVNCAAVIQHSELQSDPHLPSYSMGSFTTMSSRLWNMTRVTVREGEERLLARELGMMTSLAHPQLLLLMGHCLATQRQTLKLVFEPVLLGSLYLYLHGQDHHHQLALGGVDLLLQVTDGLTFLAGRGLVHRAVTSHAVQMVSSGVAKLGMLEMTAREGMVVSRPDDTGWQCLYNWLSPEVLMWDESVARQESDVYSLCCLIWEVCIEEVPWGDRGAMEIVTMVTRGCSLRLDREKLPRLLYRLMKQGFVWDLEQRDLDLEEVRDMLLLTRGEMEKAIRHFPPSDLDLFTTSALQTDVRRYLGYPAPAHQDYDSEYSESTDSDCGALPTAMEAPPYYADHNRNTDHLLYQPSARLAPTQPRNTNQALNKLNASSQAILQSRNTEHPLPQQSVRLAPLQYRNTDQPLHKPSARLAPLPPKTSHIPSNCRQPYGCVSSKSNFPANRSLVKKTGVAKVEIPPSYRRVRSCPFLREEVTAGGGSVTKRVQDVGGEMFNRDVGAGVGPPRTGWEAGGNYLGQKITKGTERRSVGFVEHELRLGRLQDNNVRRDCFEENVTRYNDETRLCAGGRGRRLASGDMGGKESLKTPSDVEDIEDSRVKFIFAKHFFEKNAHKEQLDASARETFFTPKASFNRSSSQPKPIVTRPGGIFLKHWTRAPADLVPALPVCGPPAGVVQDTVLLFQGGQDQADINHNRVPANSYLFQSAVDTFSGRGTFKVRQSSVPVSPSFYLSANSVKTPSPTSNFKHPPKPAPPLYQSKVLLNPTHQKVSQSTQTTLPTPALSQSTPLSSHHPPSLSPMFCSPLLPTRPPGVVKGLVKLATMDQSSSLDSIRYEQPGMRTSTPMDQKHAAVDFSNPDGRQRTFAAALSKASQDSSLSEKTNTSGQFDTCTEFAAEAADVKEDSLAGDDEKVKKRTPVVVTFNSSVEEITTSIVSLEPDSHSGPGEWSSSSHSHSSSQGFPTVCESENEDFYCDDELLPSLELDPNMQLLTTATPMTNQVTNNWEEEQFNTAELGLTKEDSTSSDYCEFTNGVEDDKEARPEEIKIDLREDIGAEIITEAEVEVSNEVTQYESVVERTAWEGGDSDVVTDNIVEAEEVDIEMAGKLNKLEDSSSNDFIEQPYEPNGELVEKVSLKADKDCGWAVEGTNFEEAEFNDDEESVKDEETDWNKDEVGAVDEGEEFLKYEETEDNEDDKSEDNLEEAKTNEETDLNEDDNDEEEVDDTAWKEGDECVARWEEDSCWYEAVVDGVEGDMAVVTFTQFGNSAFCPVELLKDKDTKISDDGQLEVEDVDCDEWE